MIILKDVNSVEDLKNMAQQFFGDLIKGVVDVERGLLALDAELHSDLEALLLDEGSKQQDLWGINLYPDLEGDDFVEFDSMINVRPTQGNMTRGIESDEVKEKILNVINRWVKR